jgi:hypothetical protein
VEPAAVVSIVIMAGATAHAQQQRSPIENFGKLISELAQEGDMRLKPPKNSLRICRNLFSRKEKASLSAKPTSQMERKTVSNLGRGGDDGPEIKS